MPKAKLSTSQSMKLRELVRRGEVWASCTNSTLAALEKRGLAKWEIVRGRSWERWTPTDAGIEAA